MSQKKNDQVSMVCLALKPGQSFFVYSIQNKEKSLTEKEFFKEKVEWRIERKTKRRLLFNAIKKIPRTSIRKHANKLKVLEKTVRTGIKQDIGQDLNPLIMLYRSFWKTKQMQLSIQIFVQLRQLLRRNGIKCQKNLFWRHANRFEGVLI